jgi:aspartate dehydrogenase
LDPKTLVRRADLLIEAASPKAVEALLPEVIARRKALLAMSAGGLLNNPRLAQRAAASGTPVYLPSGALAGLDAVKAARVGTLRSVTLTTRKPPKALAGAPGITRRKIRLGSIKKARVVFSGTAAQAVADFPKNINVAATLALAGVGARKTRVTIVADPASQANIHEVTAVGSFGKLTVRTENRPSSENPKTSQLAVYSALATLRQILEPFRIGT